MKLKNIIVHLLEKEQNGHGTVRYRKNPLKIGDNETEFVSDLKAAYYNKSNPNYGVFDDNETSYPFQALLKQYIEGGSSFYDFSKSAMKHFLSKIAAVAQATGGYVVFAHYESQSEEFLMTLVINSKKQFNIDANLSLKEIFSLDISKLDVANSVNITKWEQNKDTYLSFARGRKDVSIYFRAFIGCTDQTSAKQSSTKFKVAFSNYLKNLKIPDAEKSRIKQEVHDYCTRRAKDNEDILLDHISSLIDPDKPGLFNEFASSETNAVDSNIKGHLPTLRDLKYYSYKSETLNISFDQKLVGVGGTIVYNKVLNELTIKEVPEDLRKQLLNEIDN